MKEEMKNDPELEEAIRARGVTRLFHFTPFMNLLQILTDGEIRPNSDVRRRCEVDADFSDIVGINDTARLDGHPECVNLSVQRPNAFFLRVFKERQPSAEFWYLIALKPECMLSDGVLFAVGNAASGEVRRCGTNPGKAGFDAMFASAVRTSRRGVTRIEARSADLPSNLTTSAQAEVMVPGRIPVSMIQAVYCEREDDARRLQKTLACQHITYSFPIEVAEEELFVA